MLFFLQNFVGESDPIMNPFYHAQDRESWYAEVAAKLYEEHQQRKAKEQTLKKKKIKSKSFRNKSFIIRKEPKRSRHLIKIIIHDLDGRNMEEVIIEPDSASVNVQYLVTSDYDDIRNETDNLVGKITKKLSNSIM